MSVEIHPPTYGVSDPRGADPSRGDGSKAPQRPSLREDLGRALLACQRASEACDRALPALSPLEDGRAESVSECLELSDVCSQAIGRTLGGRRGRFLAEELRLCARVSRACAEELGGEPLLDACAAACESSAASCDRAAERLESTGDRRAA
ncbi:MAG TPA: hypothetical protein VMV46_23220 [Thermoanaerobaculia bacterium]|nr:hypothetical protein [Thermoanaerobaculia bacterium]